jgi:ribosome-associated protein
VAAKTKTKTPAAAKKKAAAKSATPKAAAPKTPKAAAPKAPSAAKPKPTAGEAAVAKLKKIIESSLDDDKAENIVSIDLRGKSSIADWLVIASGRSSRQVSAIAEHLLQRLKEATGRNFQSEGKRGGEWVLVDTGDIIVHLFQPDVRSFYNLEKMWSANIPDAPEE